MEALPGSGGAKQFVIPEYQRPYAWTDEQVETLFENLWEFTASSGGTEVKVRTSLGVLLPVRMEMANRKSMTAQSKRRSSSLQRCRTRCVIRYMDIRRQN